MPVLTDFLPVQELKVAKQDSDYSKLQKFRTKVNLMAGTVSMLLYEFASYTRRIELWESMSEYSDSFLEACADEPFNEKGMNILFSDDTVREKILDVEKTIFQEIWKEVGFIPEQFSLSCFKTKMSYNYLSDLSQYPIVKVAELKQMADSLSFVILPIDYVNMGEIIKMYREVDCSYAEKIKNSYQEFKKVLTMCQDFVGKQQLYILAPISFYDPWEEVSRKELLPKYFSKKLWTVSTILGLMMPTQRNLYKMTKVNEENLESFQKIVQENMRALQKSIDECHKRIDWVESLTKRLINRVEDLEKREREMTDNMQNMQKNMQKKIAQLEHKLDCLLDPIIFSVDAHTDISDDNSDDRGARLGLCFGTDMPIDFFVEQGMKTINDKRLGHITHVLKI